jgi:hypothetical protein
MIMADCLIPTMGRGVLVAPRFNTDMVESDSQKL